MEINFMKRKLRKLIVCIFSFIVAPITVVYFLSGKKQSIFQTIMHSVCWVPGRFGSFTRIALLRWMARYCDIEVSAIMTGTIFSHPDISIGKKVHIGAFCDFANVEIDDYALIGSGVHILGKDNHFFDRTDIPIRLQGGQYSKVKIGYGTWIGNKAIVMADVGDECVIGAGSVVTKPISSWNIAVGVPARVIRSRKPEKGNSH